MAKLSSQMIGWIDKIRQAELDIVLDWMQPIDGRLLDIGGGTGAQALVFQSMGFDVSSIDLPESGYRNAQVFPIVEYDGHRIPFDDETFDLVFSSNVLEHVAHLREFHPEMMRVLKPGGRAVHLMPSASWRFWSMLAHYVALPRLLARKMSVDPGDAGTASQAGGQSKLGRAWNLFAKVLVSDRHGERGNRLTETFYFSRSWWIKSFQAAGWIMEGTFPVPLFYTGYGIFGSSLSLDKRKRLSNVLGSASNCFVLRKVA